jgi:transcriptional regulator with XRE-family HTH domain
VKQSASKLPYREREIAERLKAFRLAKRISRAAFAVAIGIGTERLASYETGRAPLKYKIFRSIEKEFHLNPMWLAIGGAYEIESNPFDDSELPPDIPERALFSEVFDLHLRRLWRDRADIASQKWRTWIAGMENVVRLIRAGKVPQHEVRRLKAAVKKLNSDMQKSQRFTATVNRATKKS